MELNAASELPRDDWRSNDCSTKSGVARTSERPGGAIVVAFVKNAFIDADTVMAVGLGNRGQAMGRFCARTIRARRNSHRWPAQVGPASSIFVFGGVVRFFLGVFLSALGSYGRLCAPAEVIRSNVQVS